MKLPILMIATLMLSVAQAIAQTNTDDDKNVVISNSVREFSFVKSNTVNPVQIKEESDRSYTCNNYRTGTCSIK
jgi:hypothetical protein